VRGCTTCVTAWRAGSAAPRVRPTSRLSSAYRLRCPRARYGWVQDRSSTCQYLVAHTGLMTPPWGAPIVVGCHGPAATTPAFRHWRSRLQTLRSLSRRATSRSSRSWAMVSTKRALSTSTTYPFDRRCSWPTVTAWVALRCGRKPSAGSGPLASKRGSITIVHACCPTRSRTVGIPRGRSRPSGWGIETRRPGGGRSLPARRACSSAWRKALPPCRAPASICPSSTPALPPWARPSRPARHRRSGRTLRS
jgi:hypothetical protein